MSFHFSQRTLYNHLLNNFINRRTFSSFSYVIKNVINSQNRSCVNLLRPTRQVVQVSTRRHIHLQKIGVIGVPLNKGQDKQGVELGPKALRDHGLITSLEDLGHRINDYGNIQFENIEEDDKQSLIKNGLFLSHASKKISNAVKKVIQAGEICLTLGGDHSLTTGALHGHVQVQPDLVIVWIDAHADINPPTASLTGHMHGMPLSFLIKEVQPYMNDVGPFDWVEPCLSAHDLVYIGLRDVDAEERWLIEKLGICTFSMQELDALGIAAVLKMALSTIDPEGKRPIHVSFDIDSLDPSVAGSTGTPARGGLTYRESLYIAEVIAQTGRLSALDIVEVNPLLGTQMEQEGTISVAKDFALTIFGKQRCGTLPPRFTVSGRPS
ncbi:arginase, hepatic [Octopus bimaculoides]|uniref:Arginase n=1 Tax=Octopus bimaculoides TaxID=37653 RepID=A0A0L8HZX3_OCTBM|nr:arginase, hepatic [Octopus bimaculoides]|eukprot:XP_014767975.1 PREDICTED: arginase, hepatic-like [Octopus bimaculoides]